MLEDIPSLSSREKPLPMLFKGTLKAVPFFKKKKILKSIEEMTSKLVLRYPGS